MPSHMNALPHNLKAIRKRWRMSQDDFGELLGLKRGSVSNYERELNAPKLDILIQLQDITGINIKDLCYRKLNKQEILEKPLQEQTIKQSIAEEPPPTYLTKADLYNFHELVKRVHELEQIIQQLERSIKLK